MSKHITLSGSIPDEMTGVRVDKVLSLLFPDYSRAKLSEWLKAGFISINGKQLLPKDKVRGGEQVEISAVLSDAVSWVAQDLPLNIVYEDPELLVINKAAGVVVHPGAGVSDNTLVNALLHHSTSLSEIPRAGIIHRLDKDTTGLLVVAKTLTTHAYLIEEMQQRNISRHYQALVYGVLNVGGDIDQPIARHARNRLKMAVVRNGKTAKTYYSISKKFNNFTLLDVQLETGRTHQIRVHMEHIKHPIVGDCTYGNGLRLPKSASIELKDSLSNFKRQALHAYSLSFIHPTSNETMQFNAPLPNDFMEILSVMEEHNEPETTFY